MPDFDWILLGPDADGIMWLEWSDEDGKHSIFMGDSDQSQIILRRILNPANDPIP